MARKTKDTFCELNTWIKYLEGHQILLFWICKQIIFGCYLCKGTSKFSYKVIKDIQFWWKYFKGFKLCLNRFKGTKFWRNCMEALKIYNKIKFFFPFKKLKINYFSLMLYADCVPCMQVGSALLIYIYSVRLICHACSDINNTYRPQRQKKI